MGKREIRPLATPKPLKRSSQKLAHVITSWISTDMQNIVVIPPGVSFPRMREIAHQNVYSASYFFAGGSSEEIQPTGLNPFSAQYVKRRRSAQGCAFSVTEDKSVTFASRNSRKTALFEPDFDVT